jgi:arsenite-transporting ATPase
MGKGGVGKTTLPAAVAVGLADRGHRVHLATTDPAGRPADVLGDDIPPLVSVSRIDPAAELTRYTGKRMQAAQHLDRQRRALLAEDLRSPCTQELAVFSVFSGLLGQARDHFSSWTPHPAATPCACSTSRAPTTARSWQAPPAFPDGSPPR